MSTDALPVLDATLRLTPYTMDDLAAEVARHGELRGVRQARALVPLADPRAERRQGSQLRLVVIDAGLPNRNRWVHDEFDNPVYRLDLAYRRRRVGLECDGRSHLDPERLRGDRVRMNWLAAQNPDKRASKGGQNCKIDEGAGKATLHTPKTGASKDPA